MTPRSAHIAVRTAQSRTHNSRRPWLIQMAAAAGLCLLGACGDVERPQIEPLAPLPLSTLAFAEKDAPPPRVLMYAHGSVNIRSAPSPTATVVRTLSRGESVNVGEVSNGWRPVLEGDRTTGFISASVQTLRSTPVPAAPQALMPSPSSRSRVYHTGPRGGCYTYSASGRKRYVDRSLCD